MPRKRATPVTLNYACAQCGANAYTEGKGQFARIYVNHNDGCKLAIEIMLRWPMLAENTGLRDWMTRSRTNESTFKFA